MNDLTLMALAGKTAAQANKALTFENPRVGAVIVKDNVVLATGYHHQFGQEHAEMNTFHQLKDPAQVIDATMYVTLEPCSTHGKVGSCAQSMAKWGLRRVVIGSIDPNPSTNGHGVAILKQAGIQVDVLNTEHSRRLNPEFHYYFEHRLPYVQLKLATSKNGIVSDNAKARIKLTNHKADIDVHQERASKSAILIGSQTFLTDWPSLTVRHLALHHPQPLRIVLDRRGRLQNIKFDFSNRWLIYTENHAFAEKHAYVKESHNGLIGMLNDLAQQQHIQSIMVEGGPSLIQSFIAQNLWNEYLIYRTDKLLLDSGLAGVTLQQDPDEMLTIGNAVKSRYFNHLEKGVS